MATRHRKILDDIISQIYKGKKFNGSDIRFITFKNEKLQEVLRYGSYIIQPSCEWLDKHADLICNYKHTLKNSGFLTNILESKSLYLLSKEDAEEKMNTLLQSFQKVFPYLTYMDARDANYFWNYITEIIYENSFHRQYKLTE